MASNPPHSRGADGTSSPTDGAPRQDEPPRVPRWVKVSMIVFGVLVLLVVIVRLTGLGGEHGPGRHTGAQILSSIALAMVQIPSGVDG